MVVAGGEAVVDETSEVEIVADLAAVEGSVDMVVLARLEEVALVEVREVDGEVVVKVNIGKASVEEAAEEAECSARKPKRRNWRDSEKRPRRSTLSRRLKYLALPKAIGGVVVLLGSPYRWCVMHLKRDDRHTAMLLIELTSQQLTMSPAKVNLLSFGLAAAGR